MGPVLGVVVVSQPLSHHLALGNMSFFYSHVYFIGVLKEAGQRYTFDCEP